MTALRPDARPPRLDLAIVEAAWCYYHDGMTQTDIAGRLGVSRASIVNYLSEARRRGHVRVSLNIDVFRDHALSRDLASRFGLADVLVVPADPTGPRRSAARVARAAADWLPDMLVPGDRLGVAWGETVWNVADAAPRVAIADLTVVQLVGSRPSAKGYAAEACAAMLARRFGADCVNLHVPLLVSSEALARTLRDEPVIADQLAEVAACTKTLFACGTCGPHSHIVTSGVLSADEIAASVAAGAVGVICGRLIDADGTPVATDIDRRMIGVELAQMRGKVLALLVGSGADRVAPMRAALRGGYATHLVTCSDTAQGLLDGVLP